MIDQTRRAWIVSIGQTAAGFSIVGTVNGEVVPSASLPLGLYRPSSDHLSHALMSADKLHPMPAGCPTDYVRPGDDLLGPAFLSRAEFQAVNRFTQLLLGEISAEAFVSDEIARWIDLRLWNMAGTRQVETGVDPLYRELTNAYFGSAATERQSKTDPIKICRDGLAWLDGEARARHAEDFLALDAGQQISILRAISDERADKSLETDGTRLFTFLKGETIRGFYTSQVGLKELDFKGNAFYARSPGCPSS